MKNIKKDNVIKTAALFAVTLVITSAMYLSGGVSHMLKTSIVGIPQHEPFDGTVMPVKMVPDWVHLDSTKWDYSYSQLSSSDLIDIPEYNASELEMSTDNLSWGNDAHDLIRNAKITYSVPYMGSYNLDGKEYAGSHLAVDIKIPEGTPLYAIANGTVIKTSTQSTGFGHHIVIQHNDAPSLTSESQTVTLYSAYCHMSDLVVSEGDTVKKGQQIGYSGSTGTTTTPHIHFQIDNDEAPWHPYWPFTWQEAQDAGLDFFSAVSAGLGKEEAMRTTIHPMLYVQRYMDGSTASYNDSGEGPSADSYIPEAVNDDGDEEVVLEDEEVEEIVEEVQPLDPPVLHFEFDVNNKYYVGQTASFAVLMRDQYGNVYREGFAGDLTVTSVDGNVTAKPSIIKNSKFNSNGRLEATFSRMREGKDRLLITYEGEKYYSDWFEVVDNESSLFTDMDPSHEYYEAVAYLVDEGVINGYPDGTFKPEKVVTRVESLKFIFEGIRESLSGGDLPFADTSTKEWYANYLYTAFSKGVVDGYPDGTFKPTQAVNRAEFYKILFNGMGIDINPNVSKKPYDDVPVDEWYAPYISFAKELEIVEDGISEIHPADGMTRGEVAYAIFRLMKVMK